MTVIIDGIAASMASYIAMAGREIVMAESAMMMIHNPKSWAGGSGQDLRKLASTLDKVREDFIAAYASRSRRSRADVAKMMDDETWMDANEAVAAGFADRIEGHGRIIAFNLSRFKHPPLISATSSLNGRMVYRDGRMVEDSVPETIIRQC